MIFALIFADILMAGSFALRFGRLPAEIPLFYSRIWGEDQLADYWLIFLLPFLLHFFIFLNGYIYNTLFLPDQFIKKITDSLNWFLIVTFTLIFLRIIFYIT